MMEVRPPEAGLQEQASNHLVLLRLKRRGGERPGKGDRKNRQVCGEKMSASEPLTFMFKIKKFFIEIIFLLG
jgi:hypothetical protein